MEYTPLSQNTSEDSGCLTITSSDYSSTTSEGVIITNYIETPTTSCVSRKRKICIKETKLKHTKIRESIKYPPFFESPTIFEDDIIQKQPTFLSSTLNESLTRSFEKCNLENYTPNFYVERSSNEFHEEYSKRYKLDDSPKFQTKTRSAPSTPTKYLDSNESNLVGKCKSENLVGYYFTPDLNCTYKSEKLGEQEQLQILYPSIKSTNTPLKLKTPEKLREFVKKVNSPAKKRLFECSQAEKRIIKKVDHDPVSVFMVRNDFRHIITKIFEYLSERDLCAVSKVSKIWRRALTSDYKAFPRYYTYSLEYTSNKENIFNEICKEVNSPPSSPERDNFHKCTRIASCLLPSQSIQKCLRCMQPAVIQKTISQCQNPNCEYIYCMNCLSFSLSGPENFVDKCNSSELLIGNNSNRSGLYDISNASPSFFLNESDDMSQSKMDSSGYLSETEISPMIKQTQNTSLESKPLQLQTLNKIDSITRRRNRRRSSLVSVVSSKTTRNFSEVIEPSSPPKISNVACSKQSKRNLKRLQF